MQREEIREYVESIKGIIIHYTTPLLGKNHD